MKITLRSSILILFMTASTTAAAQKLAFSSNALDLVNLGTINLQANYAVARHWTVTLGGRYNNWSFAGDGNPFQNRSRGGALGARYWLWYTYSGWWTAANLRYDEYNRGGLFSNQQTEEGSAIGGGLALGYSYMLGGRWNIDFGLGGWCGISDYTTYSCPRCGIVLDKGHKFFALPSPECQISFTFIL